MAMPALEFYGMITAVFRIDKRAVIFSADYFSSFNLPCL